MTLKSFIDKWLNKTCKVLPNNLGGQCFDLAVAYTDELTVPHYPNNPSPFPYANASQIYTDFGQWQAQYFDRIANSPTGVPQAGDIIVWSNSYGGVGHVAVVISANVDNFVAFSQNDPLGSKCIQKTYNYNFVLGWLRCKLPQATPPVTDDCPLKLTQVTAERDRLNKIIGEVKDPKIKELEQQLEALKATNDNLSTQNITLTNDLQAEKEHSQVTLDSELAKQRELLLTDCINERKALQQDFEKKLEEAKKANPEKIVYKETSLSVRFKSATSKTKLKAIADIILA